MLIFPAMAFAQSAPTIQSDKADYAPGELVTLTGSGWQPGESVHINVNDTYGATWSHSADVTADANGRITDSFNLPNSFVSDYDVTATGAQSGTATTTFTDSNPNQVTVASPTSPAAVNQGSTATYGTVSVRFQGNSSPCTVTLGVAPPQLTDTAFPAGATANFGSSSLTGVSGQTLTSTLSVSTTNATPGGTYNFHVQATRTSAGCQGGVGTATISDQQLSLVVNDITAPSVAITSPSNGDTTTNSSINVSGTASDESGIQSVKVNGNTATLGPGNNWSYSNLSLSCGSNTITAVATDNSANHNTKSSTSITVTRTCDTTPPVITKQITGTAGLNGWYTSNVEVKWTVSDPDSAVVIDSGCGTQNFTSSTASVTSSCSAHSAGGSASDSVTLKIDKEAPDGVAGTLARGPDHNGWYNQAVGYSFTGNDPVSHIASCTSGTYNGPDGTGLTVSGTCTDVAGNTSAQADTAAFDYDATAPVNVSGALAHGPDHNTWYNAPVGYSFTGDDPTSHIASCTSGTYNGPDSASASVSGSCTDNAGNTSANANLGGFKYDATKPTLSPSVSPNPVLLNGNATASAGANDATSGVDALNTGCDPVNTGTIGANQTVNCHATDNAGNTNSANATYSVKADFVGFLQPVDGNSVNTGKYGRTYPIKWQLRDSSGALISDTTAQLLVATMTGGQKAVSCTSFDLSDSDVLEESTTGNTALRYDATSDQFIYNYKAPSSGTCYVFAIRNADGLTTQQIEFKFTK